MLKRIGLSEATGKMLIAGTFDRHNRSLLLVFYGEFYVQLSADRDYDSCWLQEVGFNYMYHEFSNAALVEIGMMTEDEIASLKLHEKREEDAKTEAAERAQYQKLHAKYGRDQ